MRGRGVRKREKDGRVGRGKESEWTSDLCKQGGAGEEKGAHAGAEIKKREQEPEEKIADSESVSARPFNDGDDDADTTVHQCHSRVANRRKNKEKPAKDTKERSTFLYPSRLKMEVRWLERRGSIHGRKINSVS